MTFQNQELCLSICIGGFHRMPAIPSISILCFVVHLEFGPCKIHQWSMPGHAAVLMNLDSNTLIVGQGVFARI